VWRAHGQKVADPHSERDQLEEQVTSPGADRLAFIDGKLRGRSSNLGVLNVQGR
jgi:hypothetical protein